MHQTTKYSLTYMIIPGQNGSQHSTLALEKEGRSPRGRPFYTEHALAAKIPNNAHVYPMLIHQRLSLQSLFLMFLCEKRGRNQCRLADGRTEGNFSL